MTLWREEETRLALGYYQAGRPLSEIGAAVGRKADAVAKHLKRAGTFTPHSMRRRTKSPIIAELIKARIRRGLTQAKLGEIAGYDSDTIGWWEREGKSPRLRALTDWCQALNVKLTINSI